MVITDNHPFQTWLELVSLTPLFIIQDCNVQSFIEVENHQRDYDRVTSSNRVERSKNT